MASNDAKNAAHAHLTDQQLAQFQDGVLAPLQANHLDSCAQCNARLKDIRAAETAYMQYRDSIRGPLLPPPPRVWRTLDALIAENADRPQSRLLRWWSVPALAAALSLVAALVFLESPARRESARASELLEQSSAVAVPPDRRISVQVGEETLFRPAVLSSAAEGSASQFAHLERVFVTAHYSWRDPLSPRSFQAWRKELKNKRDFVSTVEQGGKKVSYRVRTDSATGTLRSAALTLRAADLRAVGATFDFQGEGRLDMNEAQPGLAGAENPPAAASERKATVEAPAGPEDVLQVLAALNAIGADAGEPIDVSLDALGHSVAVHGNGVTTPRQREVERALHGLRRVVIHWDTGQPGARPAAESKPEKYSSNIPRDLGRQFEDRAGGLVAFQELTDRVLEDSASALARAHALTVLASMFPVPVAAQLNMRERELLRKLKRSHIVELDRLATRMRSDLKPILPASGHSANSTLSDNKIGSTWQTETPALEVSAREVDRLANSLLAGNYTQKAGEVMLTRLSSEIASFERAIQSLRRGEQ